MKTFPTSAVWCLGILFISVSLITTGSSEVQVVGPADPVVALAGDDIILPCSLKPNVNAENMVVRWTRLNLTTENVHLYRDGRDSNEDQSPSYRGRTSMFNEELKNGNVSLKLTRVTLSDAGSYMCFIPTLTSQVKETTVQLLVGAVSQPVISIDGTKDWGVFLRCESGGWFPEPEMEWLDSSGTILPADGPPERHRDSEGLYTVRRHVTVNRTDTNRFTCRVQQQEINHMKETEIHVPDDVFPKSHVGLIVGLLIAAAVGVIAASAGVFMWRKHTEEKSREELEEQMKDYKLEQEKRRDVQFVNKNKVHLIQNVTMVITIAFYLIHSNKYCQIHAARTRQDQMRLLFKALGRKKVKSDFYRILLDLEPDVVIEVGASFVDDHKDQLIQKVTQVKPIMYELFYKELYGNIKINQMNRQEQMRLLYEALEEAGDTRRVKSDFYRILLDLEPDVVKDLSLFNLIDIYDDDIDICDDDIDICDDDFDELKEELRKAKEFIQSLSTSPGGPQKTQTPSQNVQMLPPRPNRLIESEGIEGVEMESLPGRKSGPGPGRKSAPEMKPLLAAGPQKEDLDELERGGRDTTEFNYRETIPSGRKSGPEKEMEMKPLLGPGPQKDDLDELERGGRVTTEFNYVL